MWGAPVRDRWRGRRDPRQARFLTLASLRWVLRHRAYTPWYLVRYARLLRFRLANFVRFRNGRVVEFREFANTFDLVAQALGRELQI